MAEEFGLQQIFWERPNNRKSQVAHFDVENVCVSARAASSLPVPVSAFDHNRKLTWRDLIDEPVDLLHARRTTDHIAIAMVADGKNFHFLNDGHESDQRVADKNFTVGI